MQDMNFNIDDNTNIKDTNLNIDVDTKDGNFNANNIEDANLQYGYNGSIDNPSDSDDTVRIETTSNKIAKIIALYLVGMMSVIALFGVLVGITDYGNMSDEQDSLFKINNYKLQNTAVTDGNIKPITDASDVVEEVMPSVVAITETSIVQGYYFGQLYSDEVSGSGSGIIIGENDNELLIVTNNHVVADADSIEVQFVDEAIISAKLKAAEPSEDLAILSINKSDIPAETYNAIKIAKIGDSDKLRVGDVAIAIGNALGYGQSVTLGYISAKDREIELAGSYAGGSKMKVLQTDAAINPGNSGGALVNMNGEVIGINSAKLASAEVEGMGYAIPISNVGDIISEMSTKEILMDEDKGFLGISGSDVTQQEVEMLGYPEGVKVAEILSGGGAEKADIKVGDIITELNGKKIMGISDLADKVSSIKKGTEVKITLMRAYNGVYKENKVKVTLTERLDTEEKVEDIEEKIEGAE